MLKWLEPIRVEGDIAQSNRGILSFCHMLLQDRAESTATPLVDKGVCDTKEGCNPAISPGSLACDEQLKKKRFDCGWIIEKRANHRDSFHAK